MRVHCCFAHFVLNFKRRPFAITIRNTIFAKLWWRDRNTPEVIADFLFCIIFVTALKVLVQYYRNFMVLESLNMLKYIWYFGCLPGFALVGYNTYRLEKEHFSHPRPPFINYNHLYGWHPSVRIHTYLRNYTVSRKKLKFSF